MLSSIITVGRLKTMVNYKSSNSPTLGLLSYPVLMAADILLYSPRLVPVGSDQTQHIELYHDCVRKLKALEIFVPETEFIIGNCRVMDLKDPSVKMSKSNNNEAGLIKVFADKDDIISRKIMGAVTSSVDLENDDASGTVNLLNILASIKKIDYVKAREMVKGMNHEEMKRFLCHTIHDFLKPYQETFKNLSDKELIELLNEGRLLAMEVSEKFYNTLMVDMIGKVI